MRTTTKKNKYNKAFSLIEVITTLTLTSLIMIATLTIYAQVRKSAAAVSKKMSNNSVAPDVLQLIAEDIDRLSASGMDARITIRNRIEKGINKTQLTIRNNVYGKNNTPKLFEEVTWQSYYDEFDEQLYLYRSHGGIALEDSLLNKLPTFRGTSDSTVSQKDLQKNRTEMFIPVCWGMTAFEFSIPQGPEKEPLRHWANSRIPNAITVSISFTEPIEDISGKFVIPPGQLYTRTIATDRTRKIGYKFVRKEFDPEDPNSLLDGNNDDPNSVEDIVGTDIPTDLEYEI